MVSLVGELITDFASLEAKMDKVENTIADPAISPIETLTALTNATTKLEAGSVDPQGRDHVHIVSDVPG